MKKRLGSLILFAPMTSLAIVGGQSVRLDGQDAIKSVVAVLNQETSELCSGTLIDNHLILTAAHCVGKSASTLMVIVGERANTPRALFIVDRAVAHSGYNGALAHDENDLALLYFNGDLPKFVHPARIAQTAQTTSGNLPSGQKLVLAGYGISSMKYGGEGDGVLRRTIVTLDNADFAENEFSVDQSGGHGGCEGDSGGPAFIDVGGDLKIVGVLSRPAEANLTCRKPTVFAKVDAFKDWIQKNSQALKAKSKAVYQARLLNP